MRIAARKQRVENLGLKTWPPTDEVPPRNEVIHLDKWRADASRNPRSQSALAGARRTIDTDNAQPTICSALHDLGKHVVKAQYRHTETIAALASVPPRWGGFWFGEGSVGGARDSAVQCQPIVPWPDRLE